MLHLNDNRVAKIIGVGESGDRFLAIGLYQGVPKVDQQYLLAKSSEQEAQSHIHNNNNQNSRNGKSADSLENPHDMKKPVSDPTLFCTRLE